MKLHPKKLITIVCEAIARDSLIQILRDCGAKGYTVTAAEGWGAKGSRSADIPEDANIELKIIVGSERADLILGHLSSGFLPRFATVVCVTDVQVLRPDKF
ncbi:MAG: nitrogen regulatory protein P-II [Terrimicrobiaceae bacterium]